MTYSFSDPNDPRPDDPRYNSEDEAIRAAQQWCIAHDDILHVHVLAIWREWQGGAELTCLIHAGEVWRP